MISCLLQSDDRADGFTLIETLVAMSLLGLLSVFLLGSLGLGGNVMEASRRHADHTSRVAAIYDFLRSNLAQAQPLHPGEAAATTLIVFDGRRDGITFVGRSPAYLSLGGFQVLAIATEVRAGSAILAATWKPFETSGAVDSAGAARRSVLFDNLEVVEFGYFGRREGADSAGWHPEWRNQTRLPSRIRLRLALRNSPMLPELVVALPLSNTDL